MATGESWQAIMYDASRGKSITFECLDSPTYDDFAKDKNGDVIDTEVNGCGNKLFAYIYFISFMVIVSFIFLNLFIAIILESFDTSKDEEGLQVGSDTITIFKDLWSDDRFDPKGTKFIKIDAFPEFLLNVIDEEIKQKFLYDQAVKKGEVDVESLVSFRIFMFNIFLDTTILPITRDRMPIIYNDMVE